ncbi:MAG TPA: hypothetical protein VK233_04035 [Candidatus Dormibacteraeota bacterium]|nr:hypothetical protein [Candidatus Dormibacteraeota bacterium]
MSDEFEDLLKRWLRQRGAADRSTLQALAGNVAVLPPRRRRKPSNLAAAAAVIVALGLAAFALAPHNASVSNQVDGPVSPGPSEFARDPRLAACSTDVADVDRVFEMVKSRYFPLYFPGWWQGAPELEVDDPALVVIGREQRWVILPAPPPPGQTLDPNAGVGYQMCIAVGTQATFIVHNYGVTRFDRIVPVLSADDLARAQHMDPDVLADPANYPVPQRLAACGGITNQVQYVFEARSIDDYPRYFPAAAPLGLVTPDEPATIVVYRGLRPDKRGLESYPPNIRDVCILLGPDPGTAKPVFISSVDLTGFHVRIDDTAATETTAPTPDTAPPSTTPSPGPAWAANLAQQLDCDGAPQAIGGEIGQLVPVGSEGTASPGPWLYAEDVLDLPLEGWTEEPKVAWETGGSNLVRYANVVHGRVKAVLIMGGHSVDGGVGHWQIVGFRACPPTEYDQLRGRTTDDAPWVDANGLSTTVVRTVVGQFNCGWESTVWLFTDGDKRLYIRDPSKVLQHVEVGRYLERTTMPTDAVPSGYKSVDRELFTTPNKDFVYIRTPSGVERWPRSTDTMIGCA